MIKKNNLKLILPVIIFLALCTFFVISKATTTYADKNITVSDINSTTYKESIEYLLNKKIVQGYPDGTFKPGITINRAEFTKMIVGAKYSLSEIGNTSNCFTDVKTDWYAKYVCFAEKKGIIDGYLNGFFKPANTINFAEASKIIVNTFGYKVTPDSSLWYRPYVKVLSENKAIPATIKDFNYNINRGEMSEVLWRLKEDIKDKSHLSYDGSILRKISTPSSSSSASTSTSTSTSSGGSSSSTSSSSSSSGGGSVPGTYYIRTDGGTATQCNGKTNAAYSSDNQNCAWKHPFIALPPGGSPLISGGNILIIANGSYKMGSGAPGATNDDKCNESWSYDCVMAKIPSGPSPGKPTRILGEGYNSGCTSRPELWGSGRPWAIVDMDGSSNVEVQCLEITDHSECVESHSGSIECKRNTPPFGDWAPTGLRASDSSNVLLKNLDIHGLAHHGVYAGRLTDWTIEDTKIEGNGWVGWDGDIEGNDTNTGTTTFKRVNIDWNGCGQTYPGRQPVGCWAQTAGGYGDGVGTGSTGGDWIFEDSTFLHNTSDGLDLYYHREGGTVTVRRTHAEGNAGEQLKTWGNTIMSDNVVISNCGYFTGKSFTHNVDACRGVGNAIALTFDSTGNKASLYNNSIYSEGDCLVIAETDDGSSGMITSRNNIMYAGTDFLQPFEKSCYMWSNNSSVITFDDDYSLVYNAKQGNYKCETGSNNICDSDPKFTSVNSGNFNLQLKSLSPAINAGTTGITSVDFLKSTRPKGSGVDMGAYEY